MNRSLVLCAVALLGCADPAVEGPTEDLLAGVEQAASGDGAREARREQYALDTRVEARAAAADVFIVRGQDIAQVSEREYQLLSTPFRELDGDPSRPLCRDASFFGQPYLVRGLTGVVVGSRLVATMQHGMHNDAECQDAFFIVGHALTTEGSDPHALTHIPAERVYRCTHLAAITDCASDWAVAVLDRPIAARAMKLERRPLRPGTSREYGDGSVVGHPHRLPLKLEHSAFGAAASLSSQACLPAPRVVTWASTLPQASMHVAVGSSGSQMVSTQSSRVVGFVRSGFTAIAYDPLRHCYREVMTPASGMGTASQELAAAVPPLGLELESPDQVDHYGPPGGPFSPGFDDVALAAYGREAVDVTGSLSGPLEWQPLRAVGYLTPPATIEAGGRYLSRVTLAPAAARLPIGVHAGRASFTDALYHSTDGVEHRVHVGVDGLGLSYGRRSADAFDYELENRWTVPQGVTFELSPDAGIVLGAARVALVASARGVTVHVALAPTIVPPAPFTAGLVVRVLHEGVVVEELSRTLRYDTGLHGGEPLHLYDEDLR